MEETLGPLEVLLVENNPGDARLIEELLRDTDVEVELVEPGEESSTDVLSLHHRETVADGTAVLDERPIDVVLLDLNLPDTTGLDTVDAVTEVSGDVPIIVLTGVPAGHLGVKAVQRGADDYIVKSSVLTGDDAAPDMLARTIRYAIERAEIQAELRRRNEELEVLNQLTRHDIRNDMSLVVGRARELDEYVEPRGESLLEEVVRTSNHVLQLTRSIGDVADAVASSDEGALTDVRLDRVLSQELETARSLYGGGATIRTDGEVPSVQVRANALLGSVFGNLLSNAVRYTDQETPEIVVSADATEEDVTVRVTDNGPGIPDPQKERIFGKGVQGAESAGIGIGLFLVERLVDRYGGTVWIEDNDPTGSVFCVNLPRTDA